MNGHKTPHDFYSQIEKWREILLPLRTILQNFVELEESIKWGVPTYSFQNKNLISVAAFKNYACLWFYQGALLNNGHKVLVNAQEGKTKALRQWRFFSVDQIEKVLLVKLVNETIENQKLGKKLKAIPKGPIVIPEELIVEFRKYQNLKIMFEQLSSAKQREYVKHISEVKREATRMKRLGKCIPLILAKKGLYDKYKKC